jgi:hypothetical protein
MGSIVSGIFGRKAAKQQASAANNATAQAVAAQDRAIAEQRRVGSQVANQFAPDVARGRNAFNVLEFETGLSGTAPVLSDGTTYQGYEETPDFAFRREEGLSGVDNHFAAAGLWNSGAREKARMRFAEGLASQNRNQFLDRVSGLANTGFAANQAIANARTGTGSNIANLLARQGDTQAAGTIAAGNARAQGTQILGNIPNNFLNENLQVLGATSDAFGKVAGGFSSFI